MNLPNLPTDNLYKFIALSGLAVMALCLILYLQSIESSEIAQGKIQIIEERIAIRQNVLNAFSEFIPHVHDSPETEANSQKLFDRIEQEKKARDIVLAELQKEKPMFQVSESAAKLRRKFLSVGMIGGFVTSVIGFVLWYFKLQRYQDFVVMFEAEEKRASVDKSTNPYMLMADDKLNEENQTILTSSLK